MGLRRLIEHGGGQKAGWGNCLVFGVFEVGRGGRGGFGIAGRLMVGEIG